MERLNEKSYFRVFSQFSFSSTKRGIGSKKCVLCEENRKIDLPKFNTVLKSFCSLYKIKIIVSDFYAITFIQIIVQIWHLRDHRGFYSNKILFE